MKEMLLSVMMTPSVNSGEKHTSKNLQYKVKAVFLEGP